MKKLLLLVTMLGCFASAFAFRIEYGGDITISRPVYEDLYIAGGHVTINAPVYGDLVVVGGTIIINDTITNDILLAGGDVSFNGFVGDDIRCMGGRIHISKNVAGDVVIAGGDVTIEKGVVIGNLLSGGGSITIDGNISGGLKGAFGKLWVNGNVEKDIDCRGGQITLNGNVGGMSVVAALTIIIGNDATFNGDVRYWNKKGKLDFKQSLKNGKAIYDPSLQIKTAKWYYLGAFTVLGLFLYLGMALVMIMLIQYLFSATLKKAADSSFNSTLKSLGMGFLFFIVVPVAAIILFITMVGLPVGLLLLFVYITLALLATIITSTVATNWINNRYERKWNFWRLSFTAFGLFILLKLITFTPFVGWLIIILMVCIAFGSILLNVRWRKKQKSVTAA